MSFGTNLMAWRLHKGSTQTELAKFSGLARPTISRLEQDLTDPSLTVLRKLAAALHITIGELVDQKPNIKQLSRLDWDHLVQATLHPGKFTGPLAKKGKSLARIFQAKRAALGLNKSRTKTHPLTARNGRFSSRKIREELGEAQWETLIERVSKEMNSSVS